jgi:hypothetical protein
MKNLNVLLTLIGLQLLGGAVLVPTFLIKVIGGY